MALASNQAQVNFTNVKGVIITATSNALYTQTLQIQTNDEYNDAYTMTGSGEGVAMKNGNNPAVTVTPALKNVKSGDLSFTLTFTNSEGASTAGKPVQQPTIGNGNVIQWTVGSEDANDGDFNDCVVSLVGITLDNG